MNIYFSKNIKELRLKNNLTQENLADFLGVSFQTVSKWENGIAYPDITMLPDIAAFFKVSIDELLGAKSTMNEIKIQKIIEEYDNLTDTDMMHKIITDAISLYPGDFNIQLRYMADLMFHNNGEDHRNNFTKIRNIYDNIKKNCTDDTVRFCAKRYLCQYYHTISRFDDSGISYADCEKLIKEMPSMKDSRELLASFLTPPEHSDYYKNLHDAIETEVWLLDHGLTHYVLYDEKQPLELRIDTVGKLISIHNMIFDDGNYGIQWLNVIYLYLHLGDFYYRNGNFDDALKNLRKSAELSKEFDEMDRITVMHSKIFEGRSFDKHTLGSTHKATSRMKMLLTERYHFSEEFKAIPEFKEIIELLG